jgi:hypothetical protein
MLSIFIIYIYIYIYCKVRYCSFTLLIFKYVLYLLYVSFFQRCLVSYLRRFQAMPGNNANHKLDAGTNSYPRFASFRVCQRVAVDSFPVRDLMKCGKNVGNTDFLSVLSCKWRFSWENKGKQKINKWY